MNPIFACPALRFPWGIDPRPCRGQKKFAFGEMKSGQFAIEYLWLATEHINDSETLNFRNHLTLLEIL